MVNYQYLCITLFCLLLRLACLLRVYATNRLSMILKSENTSSGKVAIMLEDKSLMKQAIEKYIDEERH